MGTASFSLLTVATVSATIRLIPPPVVIMILHKLRIVSAHHLVVVDSLVHGLVMLGEISPRCSIMSSKSSPSPSPTVCNWDSLLESMLSAVVLTSCCVASLSSAPPVILYP